MIEKNNTDELELKLQESSIIMKDFAKNYEQLVVGMVAASDEKVVKKVKEKLFDLFNAQDVYLDLTEPGTISADFEKRKFSRMCRKLQKETDFLLKKIFKGNKEAANLFVEKIRQEYRHEYEVGTLRPRHLTTGMINKYVVNHPESSTEV